MPRRPRPASRRQAAAADERIDVLSKVSRGGQATLRKVVDENPRSSSLSEVEDEEDEVDVVATSDDNLGLEDGSDLDVDPEAVRVSQWVDEEELDDVAEDESEEPSSEEEDETEPALGRGQRDGLASLPLGALRKAQQALARTAALQSSDEESDGDDGPQDEEEFDRQEGSSKQVEETSNEKREIPKRKNKHAPTEVTSKRPVPRKRLPEGEKIVSRDPRFIQLSGEFNPQSFQNQYGFLADLHQEELKTLKENLKRARKLLISSPRDLREEREQEVERLQRALKRAESMVNKDRQDRVAQEALRRAKKEEEEKRTQGKGAWYMKNSDKKALLVKAKYEALAAEGGKGAVRKVIEKRQKKVSQKEKKRRPDAPRRGADGISGAKRPWGPTGGSGGAPSKRPRLQ